MKSLLAAATLAMLASPGGVAVRGLVEPDLGDRYDGDGEKYPGQSESRSKGAWRGDGVEAPLPKRTEARLRRKGVIR